MSDRHILYVTAFLRAVATGMLGILIGVYLARLEFSPATIGNVVGVGIAGGALAALLATIFADQLGRIRFLILLSILGALGALIFVCCKLPLIIGFASFWGMLNGMGRDRSASLIVEQAILPQTTSDTQRTQAFAWYNMLQDVGHALGSLGAGIPTLLAPLGVAMPLFPQRAPFFLYAVLLLGCAALYRRLSSDVEVGAAARMAKVSNKAKLIVTKISLLFSLDSLGGGFLTSALISFFFFKRFGVEEGSIGLLFFLARILNAFSHLAAAWLARRIGLLNTMVFTHIPSSFFLMTVAFAPNFPIAALLFLLREGLVEMDVPTRQSYVMAVVRPEERTFASGVTGLVRLGAWALAPFFAGYFMEALSLSLPLIIGAGLKILYDILLYFSFRSLRPPEEQAQST